MIRPVLLVVLFSGSLATAQQSPKLTVVTGRAIPKGGTLVILEAGKAAPGQKVHKALATIQDFSKSITLPSLGPFDIYYTPKNGLPVKALTNWTAKPTEQELSLSDSLGTVFVLGDDLPRADAVVLTTTDDPGPGEKGHRAVQSVGDYREDLVVPPGTYAVWVKPFNGAKAQKIADNVRVLAGRERKVPE